MFSSLNFAYLRLGSLKALCQLPLCQSGFFPGLAQQLYQLFLFRGEDALTHALTIKQGQKKSKKDFLAKRYHSQICSVKMNTLTVLLKRFQMNGRTLEEEVVADRLLLTY